MGQLILGTMGDETGILAEVYRDDESHENTLVVTSR